MTGFLAKPLPGVVSQWESRYKFGVVAGIRGAARILSFRGGVFRSTGLVLWYSRHHSGLAHIPNAAPYRHSPLSGAGLSRVNSPSAGAG